MQTHFQEVKDKQTKEFSDTKCVFEYTLLNTLKKLKCESLDFMHEIKMLAFLGFLEMFLSCYL